MDLATNDSPAAADVRLLVKEGGVYGDALLRQDMEFLPQGESIADVAGTVVAIIMGSLPVYANLAALTLIDVHLDGRARFTLSLLPNLRTLELGDCEISKQGPLLHLREFVIGRCTNAVQQDPIELLCQEKLTVLRVTSSYDMQNILAWWTMTGILHNLTELTLPIPPATEDLFSRFLQSCPSLQALHILEGEHARFHPPLPPSAIPNLRSYRGPSQFVEALVPGRPVDTIITLGYFQFRLPVPVYDLSAIKSLFHHISRSTVPVLRLELPRVFVPGLEVFSLIMNHFPMLHTLKIVFEGEALPRPVQDHDYHPDSDTDSDTDGEEESVSLYGSDSDYDEPDIDEVHDVFEAGGSDGPGGEVPNHIPSAEVGGARQAETPVLIAEVPLDDKGLPSRKPETFAVSSLVTGVAAGIFDMW